MKELCVCDPTFLTRVIFYRVFDKQIFNYLLTIMKKEFLDLKYFSFCTTYLFSVQCRSRNVVKTKFQNIYIFLFFFFFTNISRKYIYSISKSMKCLNNKLMIFFFQINFKYCYQLHNY